MKFHDFCNQTGLQPYVFANSPNCYLIYFLMRNDEITYIGKSDNSNFRGRLRAHRRDKDFTHYALIETNLSEMDCLKVESGLISFIRPEYNTVDCYPDFDKAFFALQTLKNKEIEGRVSDLEAKQRAFERKMKRATPFYLVIFVVCFIICGGLAKYLIIHGFNFGVLVYFICAGSMGFVNLMLYISVAFSRNSTKIYQQEG